MFSFGIRAAMLFSRKKLPSAVGYGLVLGGFVNGNFVVDETEKYIFTTGAVSAGTVLGETLTDGRASSNHILGVVYGGKVDGSTWTTSCKVLTHATEVRTAGASISAQPRSSHAGCGNSTYGYFSGGALLVGGGTQTTATSQLYRYSNNTLTAGASIQTPRTQLTAASNEVMAVTAAGWGSDYSTYIDRYTFANNTNAVGSALSLARVNAMGMSSPTQAWFCGGSNSSGAMTDVQRFNFADNNWTPGNALTVARHDGVAMSSPSNGYVMGGRATNGAHQRTVDIYNLTNGARSTGTLLSKTRSAGAGMSSTPGGFAA